MLTSVAAGGGSEGLYWPTDWRWGSEEGIDHL